MRFASIIMIFVNVTNRYDSVDVIMNVKEVYIKCSKKLVEETFS